MSDSILLTDRLGYKPSNPQSEAQLRYSKIAGSKPFFTTLFILTPVSVIASIVQLALAAAALGRLFDDTVNGYLPQNFLASRETLELVSAILNLICAVIMGGAAYYASVRGPIGTLFSLRVALLVGLASNAIISLAAFLYAFISHGVSGSVHLGPAPADWIYKGNLDLETWACQLKDLDSRDYEVIGQLSTLCTVEAGARWTTLFLLLLGSALLVLLVLDRRGEKRLFRTWKTRTGAGASWLGDY